MTMKIVAGRGTGHGRGLGRGRSPPACKFSRPQALAGRVGAIPREEIAATLQLQGILRLVARLAARSSLRMT